ncbi:MAG: hypothetical protein BMS9Abin32_385 [Gammaproteobacteria bacterium]|nr:MAG: hypothetical protein BMS9Abin32_385 [Gammaproteobacteria bacterium]
MQPIAAWLVARPQNAVLGLAVSLLLPFAQILSGAVMVLVALQLGARRATLSALLALAVLSLIALLVGASALPTLANALATWLPALLLAALLYRWRSLTLTLQVSAIVAMLATLTFYIVLDDPAAFWSDVLTQVAAVFREAGLLQQADLLEQEKAVIAPQMTMLVVIISWSMYVLVLLLGYAGFQALPGKKGVFGRFCDLNFGRVLAVLMALASLLAVFISAEWLQNLAFVMLAIFWVQGLAIVHWLHAARRLPVVLLIATYALLPLLNALLVLTLAAVGYVDAWFAFRTRGKA